MTLCGRCLHRNYSIDARTGEGVVSSVVARLRPTPTKQDLHREHPGILKRHYLQSHHRADTVAGITLG